LHLCTSAPASLHDLCTLQKLSNHVCWKGKKDNKSDACYLLGLVLFG